MDINVDNGIYTVYPKQSVTTRHGGSLAYRSARNVEAVLREGECSARPCTDSQQAADIHGQVSFKIRILTSSKIEPTFAVTSRTLLFVRAIFNVCLRG